MPSVMSNLSDDLKNQALAYHRFPKPGKLEIAATKPLGTQHDLALAYSPGVAAACEAIAADPREAAELTGAAKSRRRSSPTAARCWASAISGRWPPSR